RDEPLFEISTDKVDAEIPSPTSGTLLEIKVAEGETVPVNSVVAVIGSGDTKPAPVATPVAAAASAPAVAASAPASTSAPLAMSAPVAAPAVAAAAPVASTGAASSAEDLRRIKSSPVVRKIAEEHGIDIAGIHGTGIDGRVTKQDILKFIEAGGAQQAAATAQAAAQSATPVTTTPTPATTAPAAIPSVAPVAPPNVPVSKPAAQPFADSDRVEIVPMTIMRRKIAERMVESKHTSAHVYSLIEVDYSKTAAVRDKLKKEFLERDGVKLTYMPFIIKAVLEGLKKFPIINASVWGDQIVYKKDYNIGVAVALDWGLIVPVVRNADEKSLLGIARTVNDLGDRARHKKLKPDEVQGGTFTITNPGVFGGLIGLPVINQPQVAILGVGGIKKRPVVVDDAIAIRQTGMLSLSYDHRVVDGADADQFLALVRDVIEKGEFTS
ncbi:MAG: 2-oxo acid dehydrogenase subunit E2, partial [Acidobacteria bacterium]|nr:2-oxo acid dehydrogenase subunit E2 [Acidobacteriota bacterium]